MALGSAFVAPVYAALLNSPETLASNGRFGVAVQATAALGLTSAHVASFVPEEEP
jgi:hypothetical protein